MHESRAASRAEVPNQCPETIEMDHVYPRISLTFTLALLATNRKL